MSVEVTDSLQSPSAMAPLTLRGANSCRNYLSSSMALLATVGRRAGIRLAVRGAGLATIGIGTRLVTGYAGRLVTRRSVTGHVLGIACGRAGITTEHLIQGLIQRIRKSYLITERDQRLLEQRE